MKKITFFLLILFILTIPIEDSLALSPDLSVNRVVGMGVIGVWGLSIILRRGIRRIHPFIIVILLFVLWNLLSVYWTIDHDLTIARVKTYAQLAIMSVMIWDLVDEKWKLLAALQAYIIGAYISVIGTMVNFGKGEEAYLYSGGRYVATGFNANDLAVIIALGIPLAWYLVLLTNANPRPIVKWLAIPNLIYIPAGFFAIFLTGSRGGFLVSLISLFYILLTINQLRFWVRVPFILLVIVLLITSVSIIPDSTMNRVLSTFTNDQPDYLGGRLAIFEDAANIIDAHPLLGIGSGAFKSATRFTTLAHNSFLSILSETGIIGFLLFTLFLIFCVVEIFRHPKKELQFWMTLLTMWVVGGSSVSWEFRKPTWLFLTLIIASAALIEKKKPLTIQPSSTEIIKLSLLDHARIGFADESTKT